MTNQLASLAQRDYFYLDPFWSVNLGMYIINSFLKDLPEDILIPSFLFEERKKIFYQDPLL